MLVTSNFYFSNNIFGSFLSLGHLKQYFVAKASVVDVLHERGPNLRYPCKPLLLFLLCWSRKQVCSVVASAANFKTVRMLSVRKKYTRGKS